MKRTGILPKHKYRMDIFPYLMRNDISAASRYTISENIVRNFEMCCQETLDMYIFQQHYL